MAGPCGAFNSQKVCRIACTQSPVHHLQGMAVTQGLCSTCKLGTTRRMPCLPCPCQCMTAGIVSLCTSAIWANRPRASSSVKRPRPLSPLLQRFSEEGEDT